MAFNPISGALLQYQKSNGDLASGFYLAMEADGTLEALKGKWNLV